MSDSGPSLSPNSEERPNRWWLVLSVLVHGLIIGGLIFLIPAAEIVVHDEKAAAQPTEAAVSASAEQIQEVSEQIQATQTDEVRADVEELLNTEKSMGELQGQTEKEFAILAEKLAAEAPRKTEDALNLAAQAQTEAEKSQADALKSIAAAMLAREAEPVATTPEEKAASEERVKTAVKDAGEAQARAKDAQAAATAAQMTVAQQLSFLGGVEEAKNVQTQAASAQAEANARQDAASELRDNPAVARQSAEKSAANLQRAKLEAERVQGRVAASQSAVASQEEIARQQQEQLDQVAQIPGDAKAQKQVQNARTALEQTNKKLSNLKADLERNQKVLSEVQGRADTAASAAEKAAAESLAAAGKLKVAQEEALKAQAAARDLQATAQTVVNQAMASSGGKVAEIPAAEEVGQDPSLEGKSFADLYETAVAAEKKVAAQYQSIRAAQVALQKQIPLSEAERYVQVALPVRTALPPEISNKDVTDAKALEAQKAAIEKARKELASMLSLTRSMEYQARATAGGGDEGVTISAESMQAQAALDQQLTSAATETEGQNMADISGLMRQSAGHDGGNLGQGAGAASGAGKGSGKSLFRQGGEPSFPKAGAVMDALPGRKVHAGDYGIGSKWMYIDTWWVIGPFPNPQRRDLETRFPPESVVDLGASYAVEEGPAVFWHFVQNNGAQVRPPLEKSYAIYYAYTELWFDQERDLWFATGSDDFSKIWVNGMLVWASGTQQKSWRANEGYRKAHFKQGLNRILLRVENGQHVCAFSFMLCMQTNP